MSRISDLGSRILGAQSTLALINPMYFNPGLSEAAQSAYPSLASGFKDTELTDLFSWKNGVTSDCSVPMAHLWLIPGFFLLSAQEMEQENQYLVAKVEPWKPQWFPILSEGTADRIFVDQHRVAGRTVPVFYAFWESPQAIGQMYDSIETMMRTVLRCYEEGVYYVENAGILSRRFSYEAGIARLLNPQSDYWERRDLA